MALLPFEIAYGDSLPSAADAIGTFGGYWTGTHEHRDEMLAIGYGLRNLARDNARILQEFVANVNYNQAQALSYKTYVPIYVPEAEFRLAPVKYGEGYTYGQNMHGSNILYGDTFSSLWEFPIPDDMITLTAVLDRPLKCRHTFLKNAEFTVTEGKNVNIWLSHPSYVFAKKVINHVNHYVVWAYMPGYDKKRPAVQFGYDLPTSLVDYTKYKTALAVHETKVLGASDLTLRKFIAGAANTAIALSNEQVIRLLANRNKVVVITDRNSYVGREGETTDLTVGTRVQQGDFIFNTVRFTEFEDGIVPAWLKYLEIPKTYTNTTENVIVASGELNVSYLTNGPVTRLRFPITAFVEDVDKFFEHFDKAAVNASPPLVTKIGLSNGLGPLKNWEGLTSTLPSRVDVLQYIVNSWLYHGTAVAQVDDRLVDAKTRQLLRYVGEAVAPWTGLIVQYTINEDAEAGNCRSNTSAHAAVNTNRLLTDGYVRHKLLSDIPLTTCCRSSFGVMVATLGELTTDATQVTLYGSAVATLGALTVSSTGALANDGALSGALGAVTLSAAGFKRTNAVLEGALGPVTLAAEGGEPTNPLGEAEGSVSVTLGALTSSSEGDLLNTGALEKSLNPITAGSRVGKLKIKAVQTSTLGELTLTSAGKVSTKGSVSGELGALTASGTGLAVISGSVNVALSPLVSSSTGSSPNTGILEKTLGNMSVSAAGVLDGLSEPL